VLEKNKKDEVDWKKKVKRFLIISMSNVPSAVVIFGAEKGKYEG